MQIAQVPDVRAQRGHHAPPMHGLATLAPHDIGAAGARSDQAFLALLAADRGSGDLAAVLTTARGDRFVAQG